jgi:riboflavin kinase/FMN adenylyltransferase
MSGIYGFGVEEVEEFLVDGIEVSSTRIRKALYRGDIGEANRLLGYEYSITGRVVHGNRIGHQLGFPTANIEADDKFKLIAANGVYASRVEWGGKMYHGMSNIGVRPTISDSKFAVEVNIFDFDEEIYDESLTVYFVARIRDEVKFSGLPELKIQLATDKEKVIKMLGPGKV